MSNQGKMEVVGKGITWFFITPTDVNTQNLQYPCDITSSMFECNPACDISDLRSGQFEFVVVVFFVFCIACSFEQLVEFCASTYCCLYANSSGLVGVSLRYL